MDGAESRLSCIMHTIQVDRVVTGTDIQQFTDDFFFYTYTRTHSDWQFSQVQLHNSNWQWT